MDYGVLLPSLFHDQLPPGVRNAEHGITRSKFKLILESFLARCRVMVAWDASFCPRVRSNKAGYSWSTEYCAAYGVGSAYVGSNVYFGHRCCGCHVRFVRNIACPFDCAAALHTQPYGGEIQAVKYTNRSTHLSGSPIIRCTTCIVEQDSSVMPGISPKVLPRIIYK